MTSLLIVEKGTINSFVLAPISGLCMCASRASRNGREISGRLKDSNYKDINNNDNIKR